MTQWSKMVKMTQNISNSVVKKDSKHLQFGGHDSENCILKCEH
jgi:hypothetical protein